MICRRSGRLEMAAEMNAKARAMSAVILLLIPGIAHAQYVPFVFIAAAVSPLFVLLLAIILGFATKSWRVGVTHAALLVFWVLLFLITARTVENDYVIWTPIGLYAAHTVLILILIVNNMFKRSRPSSDRLSGHLL